MKLLLDNAGTKGLAETLRRLHELSSGKRHRLVNDPAAADLIILSGLWSSNPASLTAHPLFAKYPAKCVAFTEDDIYLPLLPGVYCSPRKSLSSRLGRVRSFSYISRHAGYGNPHVRPLTTNKDLLFSFQGASTCFLRKRLFRMKTKRADVLIENTSGYWNWDQSADRTEAQQRYAEIIARSRFVLCPRGSGTGSHRLFEVMSMGVAPVLLADNYLLPAGPDWDCFLIRIPEKQLHRLPEILESRASESEVRGRRAREEWLKWFSPEQEFNGIVDACHATVKVPAATLFRLLRPLLIFRYQASRIVRRSLRALILKTFEVLDVPFPFALRRHDK